MTTTREPRTYEAHGDMTMAGSEATIAWSADAVEGDSGALRIEITMYDSADLAKVIAQLQQLQAVVDKVEDVRGEL